MKKMLCLLMLACLLETTAIAQRLTDSPLKQTGNPETSQVIDSDDALMIQEEERIAEKICGIEEAYQMDVVVLVTGAAPDDDTEDLAHVKRFADDYYDNGGFGMGRDHSGIIYLIDLNNDVQYVSTCGRMIGIISDQNLDRIFDAATPALSDGRWGDAAYAAVVCVERILNEEVGIDGFRFEAREDGTARMIGYVGSEADLTIPEELGGYRVTEIGKDVFRYKTHLVSVCLPASLEILGEGPFQGCRALSRIAVSPDNPVLASIDGVLFDKVDKKLISYPAGAMATEYTVPTGIRSIGAYAFADCNKLQRVKVPEGVAVIGEYAFWNSMNIAEISLPMSLTAIADFTFVGCRNLREIAIPAGVESIGEWAFQWCVSLTEVNLSEGLKRIERNAFALCKTLPRIEIPESVTSIDLCAFGGCDRLTEVIIPAGVTFIGDQCFMECSLVSLTVPRDSYAASWAEENGVPYVYPDSNDWLQN